MVGCMGLPNWTLPVNPPSPGGGLPAQGGGILVYAAKGRGTWVRPLQGSCASGDIRVEVRSRFFRADMACRSLSVSHANGEPCGQVDASSSVKDGGVLCISDHESYESLPMAAALGPDNAPSEVLRMCCGSLCKYAAVAVGAASAYIQHPVRGFPRLKVRHPRHQTAGRWACRPGGPRPVKHPGDSPGFWVYPPDRENPITFELHWKRKPFILSGYYCLMSLLARIRPPRWPRLQTPSSLGGRSTIRTRNAAASASDAE